MKAMILAAGLGVRMRPLTESLPKPLLTVQGKPLVVHHLEALAAVGINEVIINVSYMADLIVAALGAGERWGLQIRYSHEESPLESAGGVKKALPLLGEEPFLLVSSDVFSDFGYGSLQEKAKLSPYIVLVKNPPHHIEGDFSFHQGQVIKPQGLTYTYSGIGVFSAQYFTDPREKYPLREVLWQQLARQHLRGELYQGRWCDVGTPQRLAALNQ